MLTVTGTVKYPDGAVPKGEASSVWFESLEGARTATGAIQEDGSYSMMTMKPGDGMAPGKYKVVLRIWKSYRGQIPAVPEKYTDAATTPLEATVDSEHTHFDFVVEK